MIEIVVCKRFGDWTLDVALSAQEKQIVALFGPSGAGKSLTLAAIAGFMTPDSGRIVAGTRVLFDSARRIDVPARERRIGLVRQDLALFPHLTVAENVAYGLHREPASRQRQRARELLGLMRMLDLENRFPRQLSGGQQQRVALARALAPRPALLLLDEPFSALDAPTRMQLREELLKLQREMQVSMVFVTHDLGEAYILADRLAVIHHGRIVQADSPGEVLIHPNSLPVARAVGVKNILPGVVESSGAAGCGVRIGGIVVETLAFPFKAGTPVHVCLRPERIMLLRPERTGTSSDENALAGEIVREMSDGMTTTLFFRALDARLAPTQDYDLQIELPVYIYERLNLARRRMWTVSLRRNAMHLIP